jgi:hypothetical protein
LRHLKIIFLKTTAPDSFRFTLKLYDLMQIKFYQNHGPRGSGEATIGKIVLTMLKKCSKIFSRTSLPISMKLATKDPWKEGNQSCSNIRHSVLQVGDNCENAKKWWGHSKVFF